jgi:hypothetical protein
MARTRLAALLLVPLAFMLMGAIPYGDKQVSINVQTDIQHELELLTAK